MTRHQTFTILVCSVTLTALFLVGGVMAWVATKSALITILCVAWFITGALSMALTVLVYTLRETDDSDVEMQ